MSATLHTFHSLARIHKVKMSGSPSFQIPFSMKLQL